MAGDTRDPSTPLPGNIDSPEPVKSPKVYESFNASPPQSDNMLPYGYGQNTAGSKHNVPTMSEALKTVKLEDFTELHKYPCTRESLITGIGGAFFMGGTRMLFGSPVITACNWAVGTFCLLGIGSYEYCLQKRRMEKGNMKRVIEVLDRKRAEQAAEKTAAQEAAAQRSKRLAEEELQKAKKSSWRFW